MKQYVFCALLAACTLAWALPGPVRSEARLYFSNPEILKSQLGEMLGELDICSHGTTPEGRHYLVIFAEAKQLDQIRQAGVSFEVTWADLRDKFRAMTGCEPTDPTGREFGYYFNYWEMRDTLYRLLTRYPNIVQLDSSMRSYQNRALYCLKISDNPGLEENEPQVFFNGATHAREPMGTHACVAFASLLCRNYGTDSLVTWLVNNREIYILPVMNPDGYVYNSDSGGPDSYWRKNRNNQGPRTGPGIDLNRNYGYRWGYDNVGSSPTPSSELYRGPERWSEPEVAAIRDFEAAHRFRCGIDFHTYAQDNLYAWAYAGSNPPEMALLQEIGDTFMVNNGYSNTGQWYYTLYTSNGVSLDWELADTLLGGVPKFISYVITSELGIYDFWYGWDNPPYVDAEVALQMPNCYYMTRLAGAFLEPQDKVVNDTATGNGNGELDPGETANLWFKLRNRALHALDTAGNVTAVLRSSDSLVQVLTPSSSFPDIPRRSLADNRASPIQVVASPALPPGRVVNLRLEVTYTDDGVTITQPLSYQITIGSHTALGDSGLAAVPGPELRAQPNPSRGSVFFSIASSEVGSTLRIYSATGTLVKTLPLSRTVVWDRRDMKRELVPGGVYYARVAGEGHGAASRVVIAE